METVTNERGQFDVRELCGWGVWSERGAYLPRETRRLVAAGIADRIRYPAKYGRIFNSLRIVGDSGPPKRSFLFELARKLIGGDVPNIPQEVGDCVSWGAKHAIEYVQFAPMANGTPMTWTQAFSPYIWGMSRLASDCGNNELGTQDGSVGAWAAKAVTEYGCLALDASADDGTKLPPYSGRVARAWGNLPGPSDKWVKLGRKHLVRSTAAVRNFDDLTTALSNGYPVTVASDCGYTMLPQKDGFHKRGGEWSHQMCFIGTHPGDDTTPPHACVLNSWGDVHGEVYDFTTKQKWPVGTLRISKADAEEMLAAEDSFAYSSLDYFAAQQLPRNDFDPW